jgi:tetratricopeptide (TPR) repeat protein
MGAPAPAGHLVYGRPRGHGDVPIGNDGDIVYPTRGYRRSTGTGNKSQRQYQTQLAWSSNHLALLQSRAGLVDEAEEEFLKAVRLQQGVLDDHPRDQQVLHNQAATLGNVGYFFADRDPSRARQFYEQSIAVHQRLVELYPSITKYRRNMAVSHSEFGSFLARQGEPQRARSAHSDAIDILEPLWKQNRDLDSARALAVAYNNLGMTQDAIGKLPEALQSFSRARDAQQARAQSELATPADASRLGGIYNNLGMVFERQNCWRDAAASYAQALECQQKAVDVAPTIREFSELIVKHRRNHERVLRMVNHSL